MTGAYESEIEPHRPTVDAAKLWTGGAATALVAALITVVGILLALGAAVAALAATGLIHVLLLFTPRPMRFFGWVVTLVTAGMVLAPFTTNESTASKVATAVLNLILGIAIGSLVAGSARSAVISAARRPSPGYR